MLFIYLIREPNWIICVKIHNSWYLMKITLVYPEFPDTFWSFKHALKFIRKKASSPPLGLLTIASMLPKEWELKLVDMNVQRLNDKDIRWADYIFISAMTVQRASSEEVIRRCNELGVKVVAGGPLFTMEPEHFKGIDHFILNEAEITLGEFIKDLQAGKAEKIYQTDKFADMHETPPPMWNLINFKNYATMAVQYTRGCPFNCDFCNITALLGHKMRLKNSTQMIAELDSLYDAGWRSGIFFVDDNLIGNKKLLKEDLLPALIEWRVDKSGIYFHTEVSINLSDDPVLMDLMVKAGFNQVFIGIETPDEDNLKECGKRQNLNRDMVADIRKIQNAGMQVQGGFIVGFDHDTPSTFERLTDFIQKSGVATAMVGILQAPIGTMLYDRMQKAGRLIKNISGDNVNGSTNIITRMNIDKLKTHYRKLLQKIYSPEYYYERVKLLLQEYQRQYIKPHFSFDTLWRNLNAFIQSVFKLGIFGKERRQYWKLFFWTLFHKPQFFALAITYSIYGFHFRKVSELHVGE
jgi:radical SAM superfamily enzyme YgiQ (UPF0313 family)